MKRVRHVLKTLRAVYDLTTKGDGGTGIDLLYLITAYLVVRYLMWSNPWWGDATMSGPLTVIMAVLLALSGVLIIIGYIELRRLRRGSKPTSPPQPQRK